MNFSSERRTAKTPNSFFSSLILAQIEIVSSVSISIFLASHFNLISSLLIFFSFVSPIQSWCLSLKFSLALNSNSKEEKVSQVKNQVNFPRLNWISSHRAPMNVECWGWRGWKFPIYYSNRLPLRRCEMSLTLTFSFLFEWEKRGKKFTVNFPCDGDGKISMLTLCVFFHFRSKSSLLYFVHFLISMILGEGKRLNGFSIKFSYWIWIVSYPSFQPSLNYTINVSKVLPKLLVYSIFKLKYWKLSEIRKSTHINIVMLNSFGCAREKV